MYDLCHPARWPPVARCFWATTLYTSSAFTCDVNIGEYLALGDVGFWKDERVGPIGDIIGIVLTQGICWDVLLGVTGVAGKSGSVPLPDDPNIASEMLGSIPV